MEAAAAVIPAQPALNIAKLTCGLPQKTDGPPLEPAYDFAADADTSRTAATRPAFILSSFKRIKNLESQT